tara:strand:- start:236 stop:1105 length:870 start_codon:yes stop_codon:yes gene_type:complete
MIKKVHNLNCNIIKWIKHLLPWIIGVIPILIFSQNDKAILPIQEKGSEISAEYKKALKEYEALIKKYPDKKELLYNLANINYMSGDLELALNNYKKSIIGSDSENKSDALYNMGNAFYQMGDLQKSVELFKEALKLDPNDEDFRYNYELGKRMLEQQPPQENQNNNQNGEENEKNEQQNKENQQSQRDDEKENNSKRNENNESNENQEQSDGDNEELSEEQNQSQSQDEKEESETEQKQKSESQIQSEKEEQLGKEEAEAILNAMKANEKNLKPRKYRAKGIKKLEKDW